MNTGMCRRCQRMAVPLSRAREQEQVEAVEAHEAATLRALQPPRTAVQIRTILVDGAHYVVTWDGSVRPMEVSA